MNSSLTSTRARLHNVREEREQFDEASSEILSHLNAKVFFIQLLFIHATQVLKNTRVLILYRHVYELYLFTGG